MTSTRQGSGRRSAEVLTALGALSLAAIAVLVVRYRSADAAAASALPLAFFVSGLIGARARPHHRGVALLLAVGTSHLAAFAATGRIGASGATGWAAWAVALAGDAAYLAGFVFLALLVAGYPTGRVEGRTMRGLAIGGAAFSAVALAVETTVQDRLGLALEATAATVPIPAAVHVATGGPSLVGFSTALVAVGFGILLVRARALDGPELAALGWAKLAGVTDIRMPPGHHLEGIEAAHEIRARYPRTGVVVLSAHAEATYAAELFREGTAGLAYLLKDRVGDREELLRAIRATAAGDSVVDPVVVDAMLRRPARPRSPGLDRLTGREREVLEQMAAGRSNPAIGEALFLSVSAVEKHVSAIFTKLGLVEERSSHRRVAAVLAFLSDR